MPATRHPTRRRPQATRSPVEATPSQSCGLPSQHQPKLGAFAEIHRAGTRRSPRREPDSMKHRFFSSSCGACVTTAMPSSSMVSGDRPRPRTTGKRLLGGGPPGTPRRARRRAAGRRPGRGSVYVLDGGGTAPARPRRGCGRRCPGWCRSGARRSSGYGGPPGRRSRGSRRARPRPGRAGPATGTSGRASAAPSQRREAGGGLGVGQAGEGRVPEGEQGVDLAVDEGDGGARWRGLR